MRLFNRFFPTCHPIKTPQLLIRLKILCLTHNVPIQNPPWLKAQKHAKKPYQGFLILVNLLCFFSKEILRFGSLMVRSETLSVTGPDRHLHVFIGNLLPFQLLQDHHDLLAVAENLSSPKIFAQVHTSYWLPTHLHTSDGWYACWFLLWQE